MQLRGRQVSPVRWPEVDDLLRGDREQLGCGATLLLLGVFGLLMAVGLWLLR